MAKKAATKKTVKTAAKKKATTRTPSLPPEPERVLRTYRIVYGGGRAPETIQCHGVDVYGSCCEFYRMEGEGHDEESVSVLLLPATSFERIEFVDPTPTDVTLAPGTNTPFRGDGITDVTEVPAGQP